MNNFLYRGDCKTILDGFITKNSSVDLIYLDPPFNSSRTYSILFNHREISGQQKAYHDMWDFTDITRQLLLDFKCELKRWDIPENFKLFMEAWLKILEQGTAEDKKLLNYLMYMTQRLFRLKEILKTTGSIYFHCDPTASHYIKIIMDGIFGRDNFMSEITWKRYAVHSLAKNTYDSISDIILFYAKDKQKSLFNKVFGEINKKELEKKFDKIEMKTGRRYQHVALEQSSNRSSAGETRRIEDRTVLSNLGWRWSQETFDRRIAENSHIIYWTRNGKPRYKQYADEYEGVPLGNIWTDIPYLSAGDKKERRGYQTQKPIALLERIISASSNKGDVILDPFCGCGTTLDAAHRLERKWIGIDISGCAVDEIKLRLEDLDVYEGENYKCVEGNPDTMMEYRRLTPYEKQDWLVRRLRGLPNPKKSGDGGVDGDLEFHVGTENGKDQWGRLVFSVKTGKQKKPADVRELKGTLESVNANMGVLIIDSDPTPAMEKLARESGVVKYQQDKDIPPKEYDKIQIITAQEVIDGGEIDCPPTLQEVKQYRDLHRKQIKLKI